MGRLALQPCSVRIYVLCALGIVHGAASANLKLEKPMGRLALQPCSM